MLLSRVSGTCSIMLICCVVITISRCGPRLVVDGDVADASNSDCTVAFDDDSDATADFNEQ